MTRHMVSNRNCDKCRTPKSIKGGIQLQKSIGSRFAILFLCWDCIVLHYRKVQPEMAQYANRNRTMDTE